MQLLCNCFSDDEMAHVQMVSLEVDNLTNLAHNELTIDLKYVMPKGEGGPVAAPTSSPSWARLPN